MSAEHSVIEVFDFRKATFQMAQTTLRSVLGQHGLDELGLLKPFPERRKDMNTMRQLYIICIMVLILSAAVACDSEAPTAKEEEMELSVSSSAFEEGEGIPKKYTCEGQDISPPLTWRNVPIGTKALALIVDDPDAPGGTFTHWIVFNILADSRELPAAIPSQEKLPGGALQGKNDFGKIGYGGPCPPPGPAHHYRFTLYALDKPLDLQAGATRKQVLDAMEGNILAQGQLTGTYKRQ